ncbi:MAG: FeoB-associated Cys-rich membrane protein [Lachnospiraceae bacterium]|nr:FeoB-associated Cys-rich membrane protein [Lachnospiraceae bacterium]
MNLVTLLICLVLAVAVFFAARYSIRHGGSCESCGGGCGGCSGGSCSSKKMTAEEKAFQEKLQKVIAENEKQS